MFGFGAKDIAEVPVPGEGTVTLPAGKKVKFRYVEDRKGRHADATSGKTWAGPHADLAVTVTPAGGGPALELKKPRMISEGSGSGKIYKDLGSVELPADAECVVATSMSVTDDHLSPRVVVRA